jgi:cytochrome c556
MMRMSSPAALVVALTVCLIACAAAGGAGAAGEGASLIRDQMKTVVDPNSNLIFAVGGEVDPANGPSQTPTTDARWSQAVDAAAQLKAVARTLQRRGVAIDRGLWMSDAKLLGATAAAAERAAVARNGMDFAAAANTLGDVCTNCHARYKPQTAG